MVKTSPSKAGGVGVPGGSDDKESACSVQDPGSIPGSGRPSGEGNGNPLQYSVLENSMDRGAWHRLQSMGSQRVRHDWLSLSLPGELRSHIPEGQKSKT